MFTVAKKHFINRSCYNFGISIFLSLSENQFIHLFILELPQLFFILLLISMPFESCMEHREYQTINHK